MSRPQRRASGRGLFRPPRPKGVSEWVVCTAEALLADIVHARFPDSWRLPSAAANVIVIESGPHMHAALAQIAAGSRYWVAPVDSSLSAEVRYAVALAEAMSASIVAVEEDKASEHDLVNAFVRNPDMQLAYQPVLSLASGLVDGYEVLARPAVAPISTLIRAAVLTGRAVELDLAILPRLLEGLGRLPSAVPVGINLLPATLLDPAFSVSKLVAMTQAAGLADTRMTIELTEHQAIALPDRLLERVTDLRLAGFGVAVDDAGAGYASFSLIARLRPTTIKIDAQIVRGLDADGAHEALVEAFVSFARRIGARVVAEGIETEAELHALIGLGVDFGQGYLLGRPKPEPKPGHQPIDIPRRAEMSARRASGEEHRVLELVRPAVCFPPDATGEQVREAFVADPDSSGAVICDADGRPVGTVSRERLLRAFAGPYGWALHARRPALLLADDHIWSVRAEESFVEAAIGATAREYGSVADDLIVVDASGRVVGSVRSRDLFRAVTELKLREARDLSPLTGLPGNRLIKVRLGQLLATEESVSVSYVDIDHFKLYNDERGFAAGDDLIRQLGRILAAAPDSDFVGHVGGDDFIVVWPSEEAAVRGIAATGAAYVAAAMSPGITAATLVCQPSSLDRSVARFSTALANLKQQAKRLGGWRHLVGGPDDGPTRSLPLGLMERRSGHIGRMIGRPGDSLPTSASAVELSLQVGVPDGAGPVSH